MKKNCHVLGLALLWIGCLSLLYPRLALNNDVCTVTLASRYAANREVNGREAAGGAMPEDEEEITLMRLLQSEEEQVTYKSKLFESLFSSNTKRFGEKDGNKQRSSNQ